MYKKIIGMTMAAMMAALMLSGCGAGSSSGDMDYIKNKGEFIGGITDFAPMDYKDESGEWVGFDADLARKVGEDLGVEVKFVEIDWDNKILELDNKSVDVIWNGMTLTDEVASAMACTKPYLNNAQTVVVKKDVASQCTDVDSVKGFKYAVEAGSAGEAAAEENGFDFTAVASQSAALMEIDAGTSDAAIIDSLMAGAMVGEGTSYDNMTNTINLTTEEYVVGCRKGSDLAAFIDSEIEKFKKDGSLRTIAEEYGVQEALVD